MIVDTFSSLPNVHITDYFSFFSLKDYPPIDQAKIIQRMNNAIHCTSVDKANNYYAFH